MALRLALLPCLVAAGGRDAFGRWNTQAVEPLLREVARAKRNAEESLGSVEPLRAAIEVTTSTLERVTASTLERTEEALASLVSDPTWALREVQRRLESVEPPAWSLPWLRQGLHSHRAWQRAGRMLRSGRVEDLSGSWSLGEQSAHRRPADLLSPAAFRPLPCACACPPSHELCMHARTRTHRRGTAQHGRLPEVDGLQRGAASGSYDGWAGPGTYVRRP